MEKKLIGGIVGCMISFFAYSQDQQQDKGVEVNKERLEYRDSVKRNEDSPEIVNEQHNESGDTVDYAIPSKSNTSPGAVTPDGENAATPMGSSSKGVYDVDGKVNGKVDDKGSEAKPSSDNSRSTQNK